MLHPGAVKEAYMRRPPSYAPREFGCPLYKWWWAWNIGWSCIPGRASMRLLGHSAPDARGRCASCPPLTSVALWIVYVAKLHTTVIVLQTSSERMLSGSLSAAHQSR